MLTECDEPVGEKPWWMGWGNGMSLPVDASDPRGMTANTIVDWNTVTDGNLLKEMGVDAQKWTQEFMKYVPGADKLNDHAVFGWFANAIGAGESKGYTEGLLAPTSTRKLWQEIMDATDDTRTTD